MKKQDLNKIEKELMKSGIPLEVYALKIASSKQTGRLPNLRYELNNEIKEIDLVVRFHGDKIRGRGDWIPLSLSSIISIECKKREKYPWVFFSVEEYFGSEKDDFFPHLKCASSFDNYFIKQEHIPILDQLEKSITFHHYSDSNIPKCINYSEAFRKAGSDENEIFRACKSAVNYIRYCSKKYKEIDSFSSKTGIHSVDVYYPVVLLRGQLLKAIVKNDHIEVKEVPHVQLRAFFEDEIYVIDVIRDNYFSTYLDLIEKSHNIIKRELFKLKFDKKHSKTARENYSIIKIKKRIPGYKMRGAQHRLPSKGGRRKLKPKPKQSLIDFK